MVPIFFPLTPYISIFAYDKDSCDDIAMSNRSVNVLNPGEIDKFNRAMIENCRNVYVDIGQNNV